MIFDLQQTQQKKVVQKYVIFTNIFLYSQFGQLFQDASRYFATTEKKVRNAENRPDIEKKRHKRRFHVIETLFFF
jgi:hypothetical protein